MYINRWLIVACLTVRCAHAVASVSRWVDFTVVNGLVVIPTEVQGVKGHSVVDTGSQVTAIAQSFIKKHDLKFSLARRMKISGISGSDTRKVYRDVPVKLMGSELVFKQVVDLDLGHKVQLLIGGDFLRTLYFQFDYPNNRMRAISRDVFDLEKISNVQSKLDPVTGQPMAKVRLNDEHDAWLIVDTGNSGGILMKRTTAKNKNWLEKFPAEQTSIRGVISSAGTEVFRLPLMSIGPYIVKNARVTVPLEGERLPMFKNERAASSRRRRIQGLLGYDVLKNFLVTFDYRSGAIFIEMPKAADQK